MGIITFITKSIRRRKEHQLSGLKEELKSEYEIFEKTGINSMVISDLVRKIYILEEHLSFVNKDH